GDRVASHALAKAAPPAEALLSDIAGFAVRPDMGCGTGAVSLAEGMTAGNERDSLLVIHRHPSEGFADVPGRGDRIGIAVWAFRFYINPPHLHGRERIFKLPITGITFVSKPGGLGAPINVLIRLPDILATAGKTECFESHRFQGDVARENHQVGPRNLAAVL